MKKHHFFVANSNYKFTTSHTGRWLLLNKYIYHVTLTLQKRLDRFCWCGRRDSNPYDSRSQHFKCWVSSVPPLPHKASRFTPIPYKKDYPSGHSTHLTLILFNELKIFYTKVFNFYWNIITSKLVTFIFTLSVKSLYKSNCMYRFLYLYLRYYSTDLLISFRNCR